jgi:hypothetical protein
MLGRGDTPGLLLEGRSHPFEVTVLGERGSQARRSFEVHPFAFAVPPMTADEQEALRADIEAHGVRMPLMLFPDMNDRETRGHKTNLPKTKVLDGRHRLYFASETGKPVRTEMFEGTEQEARELIASLNFHRRHLTSPQRAVAIRRLFGEQARQEAKEARDEGWKERKNLRPGTGEGSKPKSKAGRWERRAVELAGGKAAGVSPTSVYEMGEVMKAPETLAKVESGQIRTVTEAVKQAAIERKKPEPENVWLNSVRGELSRARGHMTNVLGKLDLPTGNVRPGELGGLLDEITRTATEIRSALLRRGVL